MNKSLKTILIGSIVLIGAGVLSVSSANAVVEPLVIEYSSDGGNTWLPLSGPIFSETNFLPGNNVSRLIRITNNNGDTQKIATETLNENDPDNLALQMNLLINEGATTLYNNTLASFFAAGEQYLSDVAGSGGQTQYDFSITFNSGTDDSYQGKNLGFDLLVGFEGQEGGGGGGGLPPGLTIFNEATIEMTTTTATITWQTNYFSTSQVIYALGTESHTLNLADNTGTPPKYGYAHTTPEYNTPANPNGVTDHSVTIYGLNPGTTYYYRTVSHGSLAISQEYTFSTKGVAGAVTEQITPSIPSGLVAPPTEAEKPEVITEKSLEEEKPFVETLTTEGFLATIGLMPLAVKVILSVIAAIIIGLVVTMFLGKRKKKVM